MNKKLNYLALAPIFGTVILLFFLFIKTVKGEMYVRKFHAYFVSCALFGFLSLLLSIPFVSVIGSIFHLTSLVEGDGLVLAFILGGYLMNAFTFILVNKKWNCLIIR